MDDIEVEVFSTSATSFSALIYRVSSDAVPYVKIFHEDKKTRANNVMKSVCSL